MRGRQDPHPGGHAGALPVPLFGGPDRLIRDIVRYGDPRLIAENADVDPLAEEISGLIADMVETCHAAPGVGLAAPQLGEPMRACVIEVEDTLYELVNPQVVMTPRAPWPMSSRAQRM